jgi:LmbE family N-acetylglucosaminyl deacetylase
MASYHIAIIHAHPDDAEIVAGGTLAHLHARGHRITVITMTAGDCGTTEYGPEEIARIRQGEAARAAAEIGADYRYAGFFDMAVFNDDPSRRRVTELLREVKPDILITASPADYHCDHEATSSLVRDACFAAPAPNYAIGRGETLRAIPHLYFADPDEGIDREGREVLPHFVVDVAATLATKRKMLAHHESQRAWLQKHHGMDDYLETMETWTRSRGSLAGIEYGEGFRQYMGHPYPRTPLLQELLAGLVVPSKPTQG